MKNKELLERIEERQKRLNEIKTELKEIFFGIDEEIDSIIDALKAWYITPEIINRPVIVNLWGLTGVGKTSLIRELVTRLDFNNRFLEVQMGSDNLVSYYADKFYTILKQSNIIEGQPGIVLLDEFQRFRTINSYGADMSNKELKYQDIWMLLSDGKFSNEKNYYDAIDDFSIENLIYYHTLRYGKEVKSDDETNFEDWKLDKYQIKSLVRIMGNFISIEELKEKTIKDVKQLIKDFLVYAESGKAMDYSKLLIFISGNLDEAYTISHSVEDADTDADIFYDITKTITLSDIKKALLYRFKPEQIARMGNNHIIYPSLNKFAYQKIIETTCKKLANEAQKIASVNFKVNPSVVDGIYMNSVYPSQGTRPVFSSIHKMFASQLSNGLFWAITNDIDNVEIDISVKDSSIVFTNTDKAYSIPIDFDLVKNKEKYTDNFTALLAVHESGHAIANAVLFKQVPKQIKINLSSFKGGFNLMSRKNRNKDSIEKDIITLLAGSMAEEIVFGEELCSAGNENDLMKATGLAKDLVRRLGFGTNNVSYVMITEQNVYNENIKDTDKEIDSIIKYQKLQTRKLLEEHKDILLECAKFLVQKKEILPQEFIDKFGDRLGGIKMPPNESSYDVYGDYYDILMNQQKV